MDCPRVIYLRGVERTVLSREAFHGDREIFPIKR